MKILVHSNSPWTPSGYGNQTALLSERLAANGHDVAISAFFGLQGSPLEWNDIMVYPAGQTPFGADVMRAHADNHFDNDRGFILTLMDVWVLPAQELSAAPLASWVPLDHMHLQQSVYDYFKVSGAIPIAMSRFGQRQLEKAGFENTLYAPHAIDTEVFRPLDRVECREDLKFPSDAFVVGMVAANQGRPSRKGFPEAFMALAPIMAKRKDMMLYLHTDTNAQRSQGINLTKLAEQCGIPADRVMECDQYLYRTGMLSGRYLAKVYNACDVLLNPSLGEGFGIPIIEAQACGTRVIATDCTAMSELVHGGWLVQGQPFYTGLNTFQLVPNVAELEYALETVYDLGGGPDEDTSLWATTHYDIGVVYEDWWHDVIEEVGERVRARQVLSIDAWTV